MDSETSQALIFFGPPIALGAAAGLIVGTTGLKVRPISDVEWRVARWYVIPGAVAAVSVLALTPLWNDAETSGAAADDSLVEGLGYALVFVFFTYTVAAVAATLVGRLARASFGALRRYG